MDDMDGRTPKGNFHRELLKRQHIDICRNGSRHIKMKLDRIEHRIKFGGSEHYGLIQIADMCAYNVYRQFKDYGHFWDDGNLTDSLPAYEFFERIVPLFRTSPKRGLDSPNEGIRV